MKEQIKILHSLARANYTMYRLTGSVGYYYVTIQCLRLRRELVREYDRHIAEIEATLEMPWSA
jgi:hypothetical protein